MAKGSAMTASDEDGTFGWGLGLVAGALGTLPTLARGVGWGTLGLLLCSMALAAPLCAGLRRLGGGQRSWVAAALMLAFGPLALLGEWIARSTNHRPLGAVTFSVFALGVILVVALSAARALGGRSARKPLLIVAGLAALLCILLFVRSGSLSWFEPVTWLGVVSLAALVPLERAKQSVLSKSAVVAPVWLSVTLVALLWAAVAPDGLLEASPSLSFPFRALLGRA